jgi:NAD+ kinase
MPNRRNVYLFYKKSEELLEKIQPLHQLAAEYNFNLVNTAQEANIIVAVGGDGAFLQAVRQSGFRDDCLYAGISTSKAPSFYCDFHIDDTAKMVEAMTTESLEVRRFPIIDVTVNNSYSFYCLNECSIRSTLIKTFEMDVYINDLHFETFRGDGMVISTPTGSTAYNKSVSGAVVDPLLPCMQVSEIASLNNNTYRTLGSSFILSNEHTLTLKLTNEDNHYPTIGMDNEASGVRHVETLSIRLSDRQIKTVKLKDNSFWRRVQRTFL